MEWEVTAAQAAKLTGLSERTIRRRIVSGALPARRIASNRYAIRVRDLTLPNLPTLESVETLIARVQALESRVHLLELQVAQMLAAREPS